MQKPRRPIHAFLLAVALALPVAAQTGESARLLFQDAGSPAAPGSAEPNLFTGPDGKAYLTWIEPLADKASALKFSTWDGSRWSPPRTVVERKDLLVNWADFPSLVALKGGSLVAHWLVKDSRDPHAYGINLSRSTDGGKTWSQPVVPHRDATATEHGFVSMFPLQAGGVGAVWLDGREIKAGDGGHGANEGAMTLRYATLDGGGQVAAEQLLDRRVCDCCQTSAAVTTSGPIIVYRDRSDEEVRDIAILRRTGGRWTAPRTLHRDGWQIHGCPVNGPAVAAAGRRVTVAWFTAANEQPRVKVIFSNDAGANFGQPIQVDEGSPAGRVAVEMLADGSAVVIWLERTAGGGELRLRQVWPGGRRTPSLALAQTGVARASGFPRMARTGNRLLIAWTQAGSPSQVRTATVLLPFNREP